MLDDQPWDRRSSPGAAHGVGHAFTVYPSLFDRDGWKFRLALAAAIRAARAVHRRSPAALNNGDARYYDKLLLGDWLRREFATTAQATK